MRVPAVLCKHGYLSESSVCRQEARSLDDSVLAAWSAAHPAVVKIGNEDTAAGCARMHAAAGAAAQVLQLVL